MGRSIQSLLPFSLDVRVDTSALMLIMLSRESVVLDKVNRCFLPYLNGRVPFCSFFESVGFVSFQNCKQLPLQCYSPPAVGAVKQKLATQPRFPTQEAETQELKHCCYLAEFTLGGVHIQSSSSSQL